MTKASPAQLKAQKKYDARMTRRYGVKLNICTDSDIIAQLDRVGRVQTYLKKLIREDIKNRQSGSG